MDGKRLESFETPLGEIHVYQSPQANNRDVLELARIAVSLVVSEMREKAAKSAQSAQTAQGDSL